jgi:hypothetical protein
MPQVHRPEVMPAVNGTFQPDSQKAGIVLKSWVFPVLQT